MADPSSSEPLAYLVALDELDAILAELEEPSVDVDRLAERVKRASELIALCRERIARPGWKWRRSSPRRTAPSRGRDSGEGPQRLDRVDATGVLHPVDVEDRGQPGRPRPAADDERGVEPRPGGLPGVAGRVLARADVH